jgi:transcription elongation factor Elf1
MVRGRRRVGDIIRQVLWCPVCCGTSFMGAPTPHGQFRIVAWRTNGIRVECGRCGLRFSLDPKQVIDIIDSWPLDGTDHGFTHGGMVMTWRRDLDGKAALALEMTGGDEE